MLSLTPPSPGRVCGQTPAPAVPASAGPARVTQHPVSNLKHITKQYLRRLILQSIHLRERADAADLLSAHDALLARGQLAAATRTAKRVHEPGAPGSTKMDE